MKGKLKNKLQDSKVWKWTKEKFPDIAGKGLELFGDLTGRESVENFGQWLQDIDIPEEDRKEAAQLTQIDLEVFKARQEALTERHENDMLSDSWLSKNIRPLTLAVLGVLYVLIVVMDWIGIETSSDLKQQNKELLELCFEFYFVARGVEKVVKHVSPGTRLKDLFKRK